MTNRENLINRLANWKFEDALSIAEEVPLTYRQGQLIKRLAQAYGNSGWFGGINGELILAVVEMLCGILDKETKDE